MKPWKTLSLAVILFGAIAYIRFIELPRQQRQADEQLFLKGAAESELQMVVIERKGSGFSLKNHQPSEPRSGENSAFGEWSLEGIPDRTALDPAAIRSLISALMNFKLGEAISKDEVSSDLGVYGLDSPSVKLRVARPGDEVEVAFGKRSDFIGKRYAKVGGELFLVDEAVFSASDKDRDSFRQKSPISAEIDEFSFIQIDSVGVGSQSEVVRLEAGEGDRWQLVLPIKERADIQVIREFVSRIRSLRAVQFFDPPEAERTGDFGLDKPDVMITLGGKKRNLELKLSVKLTTEGGSGRSDAAMYFWYNESPTVYKIGGNQINLFRPPPETFRDKRIFEINRETVSKIQVDREGGVSHILEKRQDEWKLNGIGVSTPRLRSYLEEVVNFEVQRFATSDDSGEPFGSVTSRILLREGEQERVWEVGSEVKGQQENIRPLRRIGGPIVAFVTDAQIDQITPRESMLPERKLTAEPTVTTTSR
jgi:hypothetical protein